MRSLLVSLLVVFAHVASAEEISTFGRKRPRPPISTPGTPAFQCQTTDTSSFGTVFFRPSITSSRRTIKLGALLPYSVQNVANGYASRRALLLAISDMAKLMPRLRNFDFELLAVDSQCSASVAVPGYRQLVQQGAVAVFGDACSGSTLAVLPELRTLMISASATSDALSLNDLFFRTVPPDTFQSKALASLVARTGSSTEACIAAGTEPYGSGLAANFKREFAALGGTILAEDTIAEGNWDDVAARFKAAQCRKVFIATNQDSWIAEYLVAAASGATITADYFGGDAAADTEIPRLIGARSSVITRFRVTSFNQGTDVFKAKFARATNEPYNGAAAHAYDAMTSFLRAFVATNQHVARTINYEAIKAEMLRQNFVGVSGTIKYTNVGDMVADNQSYQSLKFDELGNLVVEGFIPIL